MKEVVEELSTLFEEAKKRSDFEFVLTLINFRGMGTHKLTTNLHEWFDAIEFYEKLYRSHEGKEKTRMAALLYSTFFENSDFYNIIGSLCRIKLGYRGSSYLFWKTKKYERFLGVGEKHEAMYELLHDANKKNIVKFFDENYFSPIRNSFFHSTYALSDEGDYILHDTDSIRINGVGQGGFDVNGFFYPLVENVIVFFKTFKELYLKSFELYTENMEVLGLFPNICKITILGSSKGLGGFKIKNAVQFYGEWHDSGIWYNEKHDMWEAWNLRMNMPTEDVVEIDDQLRRYEKKDDIHQSDVEFHNLMEKITDRKDANEIARATQLLLKFGGLRDQKMQQEQNFFKKRSFPKYILPFYRKAVEIGSILFDTTEVKKRIEELENEIAKQ